MRKIFALFAACILLSGCAMAMDAISSATLSINVLPELRASGNATILVAFFSTDDTIRAAAFTAADALGADVFEIVAADPYTSDDLNYNKSGTRATAEQRDDAARPAIAGLPENLAQYDTILLGYPIWWGQAPKIIYTFLESADFSRKTIIPFCTSASSGVGSSDSNLHKLTDSSTVWLPATRIGNGESAEDICAWVQSLGIGKKEGNMLYIKIGDAVLEATLADNSSAEALIALLQKGDVIIDMHDFSNFEKVGELPEGLPTNDEDITTEPGDLILYLGHRFVIYYDQNSWDFTRLGKINNISQDELKEILGEGDVTATLSLNP